MPHYNRLRKTWNSHSLAIDTSPMGAGKTPVATSLRRDSGFAHCIIVGPVSSLGKWEQFFKIFGVPCDTLFSYTTMRNCKPCHGYITKPEGATANTFEVTAKFRTMAEAGLLLIGDESQELKNAKSQQHNAFRAMARYITINGGRSRTLLISGTPYDKEEHVISMLQMVGIIRQHQLYVYHQAQGRLELRGARDLVNYCMSADTKATSAFLEANPFTHRNVSHNCYLLYLAVLADHLTSAMPKPPVSTSLTCRNGYYCMSPSGSKALKQGIKALHGAVRYNGNGEVDRKETNWGAITSATRAIELAKVEIFLRIGKAWLNANPNNHLIIAMFFNGPIDLIAKGLEEHKPLIVTGKSRGKKRDDLIDLFQQPNATYRVIVGNISVLQVNIDLDDKIGTFPRLSLAPPTYHIIKMQQFSHRIQRADTKSAAEVVFVNGTCGAEETSIYQSLLRKSTVLKATLKSQVSEGMIFPADYPRFTEPTIVIEDTGPVVDVPLDEEDAALLAAAEEEELEVPPPSGGEVFDLAAAMARLSS